MNVTAKSKWKTVPIDAQLIAQGFAEGLLGIEELSDYQLTKVNRKIKGKKVTNVEGSKVIKKRKMDPEGGEAKEEVKQKKKKKTRQKRKPKSKKTVGEESIIPDCSSDEDEQLNDDDDEDDEVEESKDDDDIHFMQGWKDLPVPPLVLKALKDLDFKEPTPIQKETLPSAILGRSDVVGAAETGSGKTLAFAIPILHGILADRQHELSNHHDMDELEDEIAMESEDEDMSEPEAESGCVKVVNNVEFDFDVDLDEPDLPKKQNKRRKVKSGKFRALILAPTRELAIQVGNHTKAVAKYTDISVAVLVGGMAAQKQIRLLDQAPEIVVATPGRLWDLLQEGHPHLGQVKEIGYLAIDETDRMIEKGHFEELHQLLEMINTDDKMRAKRQTFVFSATLSLVHEMPKHLKAKKGKKPMTSQEKLEQLKAMIGVKAKPKVVDLTTKVGTAESLTESRIHCGITEKDCYLYYFLQQHPGRTMVFCNSIDCVRRLVNLFNLLWCQPLGLHAQMHQKQRLKNLDRFSENNHGLLVATDVAARGLDIPDVEHVVQYQVPRTSESYIHRSGRTARASKAGLSLILIEPGENQFYRRMCRTLNRDEDLPSFPVEPKMFSVLKQRVTVARELDKMMLASKKAELSKSWIKKTAEEAELEVSESEPEDEYGETKTQVRAQEKAQIKGKKAELNRMLATPCYSQSYAGKYPTKSGKFELPAKLHTNTSAVEAIETSKAELKRLVKETKSKSKKSALVKKIKNKKRSKKKKQK